MSDVLAINVDQPFASLLAHGVTNWLTAAEPPPDGVTDAEWLIVSDDERPSITFLPGFTDITGEPRAEGHECAWLDCRTYPNTVIPLPLGAVLAVARVTDVVPITRYEDASHNYDDFVDWFPVDRLGPEGLVLFRGRTSGPDISDQLPYGDWTPGRWAWRMEVRRLDEPVTEYPMPWDPTQPIDTRRRRMSPVRGRQGVWRPDPALVAVVREVLDGN